MAEQLIRTMVIMMLAGLSFLQGILPDGMAYNPQQCEYCPTPTPRIVRRNATPEPTPTPEPTIEPTPTEEPWLCPAVGDLSKKDYKDICMETCQEAGLNGCGKVCGDCWKVDK